MTMIKGMVKCFKGMAFFYFLLSSFKSETFICKFDLWSKKALFRILNIFGPWSFFSLLIFKGFLLLYNLILNKK